jgi:WD40 repeat protein
MWFIPEGRHDLFVMTDSQCAVFDHASGQSRFQPIQTPAGSRCYSVSPDGRLVAFGSQQGLAGVWSLETGAVVLPPCLRSTPLTDVNFSPDGTQLLATAINGTATLLSSRLLREDAVHRFDTFIAGGSPKPLLEWRRFTPDRRFFLLILDDGSVRLVDLMQMADRKLTPPQPRGLRAIQATFDSTGRRGAVFYSGADTNLVEIWSDDGESTRRFLLPHPVSLNDKLLFTSDGSRLLTPGGDGQIRIWRTADGELERSVPIQALGQAVLFPGGNTAFAVSSVTKQFALFDLETGSASETRLPPFEITAFLFNPSGDRFATAGTVNWSRVWSARTCEPLTPLLDHGGEVRWVDWSPDGSRLLTAGLTPEVKVWDARTGEPLLPPLALGAKPLETAQWSLDGRLIVARSDEHTVRVWDATTGEPVTPLLRHDRYIRLAHLVSSNRLVTLSHPDLLRAWDLKECALPLKELADLAKLAAGRQINAGGAMLGLNPAELRQLSASLRARRPELFVTPPEELRQWHRRQVGPPENLVLLDSALFHLNRLAELAPDDPWAIDQQARFRSRAVAARDSNAPLNLVDLSRFYTHSLDTTMYGEFAEIPRGVQSLAGTLFDVRGAIVLDFGTPQVEDGTIPLTAVQHIPVGRRCRQLSFLQGVGGDRGKDGEEVAHWVIRFADGTSLDWPVIYGEHVRDWWWNYGHPEEASGAVIAWEGHPPVLANSVRLFKATWVNPRPEAEIRELDFVGGEARVAPFVVAITAE